MNNFFPLQESVCIEEVYGSKRTNAHPPTQSKTYNFDSCTITDKSFFSNPKQYDWFLEDGVSSYERNSFVFLNSKKGKIIEDTDYLRTRNSIIDIYRKNTKFITLSEAYCVVKGSSNESFSTFASIFSFLEKLNIINNRNILKECKFMINDLMKKRGDQQIEDKKNIPKISEEDRVLIDHISKGSSNEHCLCTKVATYRSKEKQYICEECLDRGLYDSKLTRSDFVKLDENILSRVWTKQEEIKLLEAVDKFGDDWARVSKHVETKGVHDCVMYFITMPIREKNLKNLDFTIGVPFIKTPNPVMFLITFICSVVHPTLGAEAAHQAMKEVDSNFVGILRSILIKAKAKAEELVVLENEKINRTSLILEEAMINLIGLKTKTYKDLTLSEEKARQELIDLRSKLLSGDLE
ncbi:SWI/SNF complex subunit SWI3C [Nosema granulosis]|uniref:SWI/SNF complex subunit SWI3C n=1 Tax=Nosema granulosis TaxID=83296 RepID=A0A9P6GZH2_9MICR|nr:SWI/SNF complex subunit SWI3C [Nosema granulosis]